MNRQLAVLLPLLAVPGLPSLSCKSGHDTSIIVHVTSDKALMLDRVEMIARPISGGDAGTMTVVPFPDPTKVTWVLYPSDSKMYAVQIDARGMKGASTDPLVTQQALVGFQPGRHIDVYMTLEAACVGVACAPGTCSHGECVDPSSVGKPSTDGGPRDTAPDQMSSDTNDARPDSGSGGSIGGSGGGAGGGAGTSGGGTGGSGAAGTGGGPMPQQLGTACTADGECASTHCVDNVCCESLCAGSCQQCNSTATPGFCTAVAANQPAPAKRTACPTEAASTCMHTGVCDGKGACQLHADGVVCLAATCNATANTITESRCDGMGACKPGTPLTCAPFRCKAGDTQCARTCATATDCDGQPCLNNSCGKLKTGATCAQDGDCELGFCVDKICCNNRCAGQCQACNLSGSVGTCSSVKSGQPVGGRTACTGSGTCGGSCAGTADCTYPTTSVSCRTANCDVATLTQPASCNGTGACPAVSTLPCMNHLRCNAGGTACLTTCATTADCVAGYYCAGTTCVATKGNGMTCALGNECTSGVCTDGHCCNMGCGGACQTCATGTCGMVVSADDADTCAGNNTCSAGGACLLKQGQTCTTNAQCANNTCVDGHCCNSACSAACQSCNNASGTCATVMNADDDKCPSGSTCNAAGACLLKQGGSCSSNAQCLNNICSNDGVCCASTCSLSCQGCASANTGTTTGTCAPRNTGTTRPCPTVNPTACVNTQTDPNNCNGCGMVCASNGPSGTVPNCVAGSCTSKCSTGGTQVCTLQSGIKNCAPTAWGFETGENLFWYNGADNNSQIVGGNAHSGANAVAISPSSNGSGANPTPARIGNQPCSDSTSTGSLDLRGKLFTAFIYVPTYAGSSFTGTSCKLGANDASFVETTLTGVKPSVSPIMPGSYFQLSGTFGTTALESRIVGVYIQCFLPKDWTYGNAAQQWYVDDVRIDSP